MDEHYYIKEGEHLLTGLLLERALKDPSINLVWENISGSFVGPLVTWSVIEKLLAKKS